MSEKINENLITYTRDTLLFAVKSICNMLSNARWTVFDTDSYFKNQEGYVRLDDILFGYCVEVFSNEGNIVKKIEFIPVKDIMHGQPSVILRIVSNHGCRESLYGLDPEMSKDDEHNWMVMIHENIKNNL